MYDWRGITALILSVGISATIVIFAITEFFHDGHLTEAESISTSTILGAAIGAIATYLGAGKDKEGHS